MRAHRPEPALDLFGGDGRVKTPRNKCLDAYATERLDPIIEYTCTGGKNQKWDIDPRGRIVLREVRGPNGERYSATIANGDRSVGARLWLQFTHGGENQPFRRDPSGQGGSTVSIESDLRSPNPNPACLDVPASESGPVSGLQAWVWTCQGATHANQRWQRTAEMEFRLADTVTHPPAMCLDGGNGARLNPVTIQRCNGGASQKWNMLGYGELQLHDGNKPCVTVPNDSNTNGNKLILDACNTAIHRGQQWTYRDAR